MIQTFETKLVKKTRLVENIEVLGFQIQSSEPLTSLCGQYVIVLVPTTGSSYPLQRLYSLFNISEDGKYFELLIEFVPGGAASTYLKNATINDQITFRGPAGQFCLRDTTKAKKIFFIATGTGIAPIYYILTKHLPSFTAPVELFWGLPTLSNLYLFDELLRYSQSHQHFNFTVCFSRETQFGALEQSKIKHFTIGRVTKKIDEIPQDLIVGSQFYVCGGKDVVESIRNYLYEKGAMKENVFFEKYTQ